MADIKIVVDTAADLPKEYLERYNMGMLHFMSIFDGEAYVADVDLDNAAFYKKLTESEKIPTTSQTPYQDMYDYLLEQSKLHDTVLYFTLSSKGSGQYNTARMIAAEIKEEDNPNADIRVIDTMSYSIYIGTTAIYAAQLAEAGENADTILEKCDRYIKSWQAYVVVDTLEYLEKGGRINKTSAWIGTLLDIKPVLCVKDGLIESYDKIRGKKKVLPKLMQIVRDTEGFNEENPEFVVVHSDLEKGKEMEEVIKEEFGVDEIYYMTEFGPIIGTHIGPGAVAVMFRLKD
ncbi:MAG: DegV family protein [Ruminococcaceae bacterium]|nr:DegV family protein [Oscillospiraceae bacterium]